MRVLTLLLLLLLLSGVALPPAAEACTSIIVGKKASSDGSVFIARNGAHCWLGTAGLVQQQQQAGPQCTALEQQRP